MLTAGYRNCEQVVIEQCRELLKHGVCGFHFYTLNRSVAVSEIVGALELASSSVTSQA